MAIEKTKEKIKVLNKLPKEKEKDVKSKDKKSDKEKTMARPKKNEETSGGLRQAISELRDETKQGILAVIFFVISLLCILAAVGMAGPVGAKVFSWLWFLFGVGYYLVPIIFFFLGITFFKAEKKNFNYLKTTGALLFFLSGLSIIELSSPSQGGFVGHWISLPLLKLFDFWASYIILVTVMVISSLVVFETKLTLDTLFFWRAPRDENEDEETEEEDEEVEVEVEDEEETEEEAPEEKPEEDDKKKKGGLKEILGLGVDEEVADIAPAKPYTNKIYVPPPLSLLERDKGKPGVGDIKANANIIKRTLMNFGIDVEMDEISIGPSITRYALKPAEGVKLSRIVALQNDLSLALAAHPIRIEAPIPGKSLVGIEIPNTAKTTVGMATLLSNEEYQTSDKPLLLALGKGISGRSHFSNLAKMPHCLIAGTTGSGKSVTIHTIINSLLFRNSPETLKFIMIDPKRVELTLYNKIPHLLTPVITDAKKTILALKWAAKEMDRRYDILEAEACKDIDSYHKNILGPEMRKIEELQAKGNYDPQKNRLPETMPYIIIVIDELADIMMTYPRELESGIVRLAQMSRAVGIHLIISTQRPSVNVITGLIKANIPSRIALQVASQIDSRTILDQAGAEKLLGAGDMLYLGGEMSKPIRVQSAYISESEVKSVVKYLVDIYRDEIPAGIDISTAATDANTIFSADLEESELGDEDDMYEAARDEVIKCGKASTSYLQRKLRLGYARAARIMDMLEERGVIGPADGAKSREVLGGGGPAAKTELEGLETTEEETTEDDENIDDTSDTEEAEEEYSSTNRLG
ncbi:MAG: DNA translocase FtsK 4TM domain-containing protein [bacterium]